tara:strand:- start:19713 stop:20144 length:432 start_codon:yes stop_codon:yes gene_type:complete
MTEYQPRYHSKRSRQVAAAIMDVRNPFLDWSSLKELGNVQEYYERLWSVRQEQIERAFCQVFHHIFYSLRDRYRDPSMHEIIRHRDQSMLEAMLGLTDGEMRTSLEAAKESDGVNSQAAIVRIDSSRRLKVYQVHRILREVIE